MGPFANTQKKREMKVYPDMDFYTKTPNHQKTVQKTLKNTQKTKIYWKPEKYWIPKYKLNAGTQFLHLAWHREVCTLASPSVTPLLQTYVVLSTVQYNNRIAGFQNIQACKIVFVARASNIRCILHQTCPKKKMLYTNEKSESVACKN